MASVEKSNKTLDLETSFIYLRNLKLQSSEYLELQLVIILTSDFISRQTSEARTYRSGRLK